MCPVKKQYVSVHRNIVIALSSFSSRLAFHVVVDGTLDWPFPTCTSSAAHGASAAIEAAHHFAPH